MSIETWKNEYYSIEACRVPGTKLDALTHSLTKWIGLREENFERHGVIKVLDSLVEPGTRNRLRIDGVTCALCCTYVGVGSDDCDSCQYCPLRSCQREYRSWWRHGDPEPMIKRLAALYFEATNEGNMNAFTTCNNCGSVVRFVNENYGRGYTCEKCNYALRLVTPPRPAEKIKLNFRIMKDGIENEIGSKEKPNGSDTDKSGPDEL